MKSAQHGFSLAIVVTLMVLVMIAMIATYTLSRFTGSRDERDTTRKRLGDAMVALDAFAAQTQRLPCPSGQTATSEAEEGVEARAGANCTYPDGVLPWKTIGLSKDAGYDGWGRRLSYRVHSGTQGGYATTSLAQDGGASMVNCDTWRITGSALTSNGLCNADRDSDPEAFLGLTRLRLTEKITFPVVKSVRNDVAYVVLSHGATGFGGYTISGARLEMPKNDELDNTRNAAAGSFTRPFSGVETKADANDHFDDVVVHRTVADLTKKANLSARDWPESVPAGGVGFDAATVSNAGGSTSSTNTGEWWLDFPVVGGGNVSAIGVQGNTVRNISFDTIGGTGGIGVTGSSSPKMTYGEGEYMIFLYDRLGSRFGMTLNDFGRFAQSGVTMTEKALVIFYRGGTAVHSVVKSACRADGGLASFEIAVGADFDAVLLAPAASTGTRADGTSVTGDTGFLISEIRSCSASTASQPFCRTSLSNAENTCGPDLRVVKSHAATFVSGSNGTYTLAVDNVLGAEPSSGTITVTDPLPNGLTFVSASGTGWSCSASSGVVTCTSGTVIAAGGSASPITLSVAVGAAAVPSVTNTATVSGGGEIAPSTLANNSATLSTPVSP